ncbi:LigA [Nocardioidaceae bacterium Broad-1]|nr:LigA [Nocardioidaceae bacterium Broad-1]
MGWFIAQSLVFILVAFAIGLLVGWLIWGRRDKGAVVEESAAAAPEADTTSESEVDPEVEAAAVPAARAESEDTVASEPEPEPEPEPEAEPAAEAEPEVEATAEAAVVAEAESVAREAAEQKPEPEPQDLKRIEGIGPKIDAALKAQGYVTYARVAAATEDELRAAIKAEGVRFAPSASSWARQAQLLADGDEDGLKEFQDYLVGGQDRSVKFNEKVDFAAVEAAEDDASGAKA